MSATHWRVGDSRGRYITPPTAVIPKRYSVDTNILVYAVDRDAGEKRKQAVELLDALVTEDCVLSLQALAEFFHVVTRKGKVPAQEAQAIVDDWAVLFPVVGAESRHLQTAMGWMKKGVFSFWDGLLFATVNGAGVTHLLTEDMQHGFEIAGTQVVHPFGENGTGVI